MLVTTIDLAMAREAAKSLLDELQMDALVFIVEPGEDNWELKLECNTRDGWQAVSLNVNEHLLLSSLTDMSSRAELLRAWREKLASCSPI